MEKEVYILIGAIIGASLTIAGAWGMWNIQIGYENTNLAHGIYKDLEQSNATICLYADLFHNSKNFGVPEESFYYDYRLSPTALELSRFPPKISNVLYEYYYNLARAESIRLRLTDPNSWERNNPELFTKAHDEMKRDIINCCEEIQPIKVLINKNYPIDP